MTGLIGRAAAKLRNIADDAAAHAEVWELVALGELPEVARFIQAIHPAVVTVVADWLESWEDLEPRPGDPANTDLEFAVRISRLIVGEPAEQDAYARAVGESDG